MSGARRFYGRAEAVESEGVYGVRLDARALRTPGGSTFAAPTRALADAVAGEWNAQGEHILPASMPMSQLAFVALDITRRRRDELSLALSKYAETDLVCHRAGSPEALVERQATAWDPLVAWGEERFQFRLPVVTGVIPTHVSPEILNALQREIDDLDDFRCTALAQAVTLSGSLLIGFALLEGRLDPRQAFEAAALDNLWSIEHWGEDAEARASLDRLERDLAAAARFAEVLAK